MLTDAAPEALFVEGYVVEGLSEGAAGIDMSYIGAENSVANARLLRSRAFRPGIRIKLILNLVAAVNLATLAEGLALGEAVGITVKKSVEALITGAAGSKVCEIKGPKIAARSQDP